MARKTSGEQYKLSKMVKWFKDHQFFVTPLIWFAGSFIGLFGLYEALDYFQINFFDKIVKPFTLFLCFSIIIMLIRAIIHLLKHFPVVPTSVSNEFMDDNDSLIEMMKEAQAHSRWAEIIKIGSALSEVLWFTSRKKLRVAIGHFVELAAAQTEDKYTQSATLIEDLGNTIMGLGRVDDGIKYINRGIKIAEDNNYFFLVMRGYRNLANCYSLKNDPVKAEPYLTKAEIAAGNITDEKKKFDALGAIEYARCKILRKSNKHQEAVEALDKAIIYYNQLSQKYPDTIKRNTDALVKIHREKGVIYLAMSMENSTDMAYESLLIGLRLARETLNYDNIVRCCSLMAKIQIDRKAIDTAEGMMSIAKEYIGKIDTPSILSEYNEAIRKLEFERYASH